MRAILTCYTDDDSDFVINDLLCVRPFIEKLQLKTYLLLRKPPPPELKFPGASYILVNKMNYRKVLHSLCTQGFPKKLLLYFSCHSSKHGIMVDKVYIRVDDIIKSLDSEVFCIFDCCNARSLLKPNSTKNLIAFYSCDEDQKCGIIKINSKRYSLFTKILFDELLERGTPLDTVIEKINSRISFIKNRLNSSPQNASSSHKTFFNWLL